MKKHNLRATPWGCGEITQFKDLPFSGCLPHSKSPPSAGYYGKNFKGERGGRRKERRMLLGSVRPGVGQGGGWRLGKERAVYRHSQQTRIETIKQGIVLSAEEVKRNFYL